MHFKGIYYIRLDADIGIYRTRLNAIAKILGYLFPVLDLGR